MSTDFDPRRAAPNQAFTWHDEWAVKHEFKADADGVVWPRNAGEVAGCDAFGLPVARKAIAEARAAEATTVPASVTVVSEAIRASTAAITDAQPARPAQEG